MGMRFENQCVDCGLPCLGDACRYRNVPVYFCDECGDEVSSKNLYIYDDQELCKFCLLEKCETVG